MLPHPWSMFKKSFTKCKFDKIDIIQYVLYIIRAIHCRYENGTLISIAILFRFLNNQPISQKNYVYMIIIPFYILSLVKIYIISNFFQVCIIRFFLQKQTKEGGAFMKQRIPFLRSIFQEQLNVCLIYNDFNSTMVPGSSALASPISYQSAVTECAEHAPLLKRPCLCKPCLLLLHQYIRM